MESDEIGWHLVLYLSLKSKYSKLEYGKTPHINIPFSYQFWDSENFEFDLNGAVWRKLYHSSKNKNLLETYRIKKPKVVTVILIFNFLTIVRFSVTLWIIKLCLWYKKTKMSYSKDCIHRSKGKMLKLHILYSDKI